MFDTETSTIVEAETSTTELLQTGAKSSSRSQVSGVTEEALVVGVGTAFPEKRYSQEEVTQIFGIKNKVVLKLMASKHVENRHLYLPEVDPETGIIKNETQMDLHQKFVNGVKDIGVRAAKNCLETSGISPQDVDNLVVVTSSGFAVPGASSMISRELGMKDSLHRLDVVGMGCNAGMSGLYTAYSGVKANPQLTTLMVCCEVNSASYVRDETIRTGIVNSLFGDGAAAILLQGFEVAKKAPEGPQGRQPRFRILDFETFTISKEWGAMRFDLDEEQLKWSFFLSKDIPFVIGENMKTPVYRLLDRNGMGREEIKHWVMHTGGKAVIDGAIQSVGLTEHDVRHTRSVLRDYGNLSSGSFLVSLERLYNEDSVEAGDYGVLIAMGPGSTIETALVQFY